MNEFKLGDNVVSKISGFKGVITAKTEYLFSGTQYLVEANTLVNGEVKEFWFPAEALTEAV